MKPVLSTYKYTLQLRQMKPEPYTNTATTFEEQVQQKKAYDTYIQNFEQERTMYMKLLQNDEKEIKEKIQNTYADLRYKQNKETLQIEEEIKNPIEFVCDLFSICIGIQNIIVNNKTYNRNTLSKQVQN